MNIHKYLRSKAEKYRQVKADFWHLIGGAVTVPALLMSI